MAASTDSCNDGRATAWRGCAGGYCAKLANMVARCAKPLLMFMVRSLGPPHTRVRATPYFTDTGADASTFDVPSGSNTTSNFGFMAL